MFLVSDYRLSRHLLPETILAHVPSPERHSQKRLQDRGFGVARPTGPVPVTGCTLPWMKPESGPELPFMYQKVNVRFLIASERGNSRSRLNSSANIQNSVLHPARCVRVFSKENRTLVFMSPHPLSAASVHLTILVSVSQSGLRESLRSPGFMSTPSNSGASGTSANRLVLACRITI